LIEIAVIYYLLIINGVSQRMTTPSHWHFFRL